MEELKIVYREPAALRAYGRNARTHDEAQIDGIAGSIQRFGFNAPVLLRDDDATIGAGHGRQAAALRILADPEKWGRLRTKDGKTIPTATLHGLTDAEWRAYVIADNRLSDQSGWNYDLLAEELRQLAEDDPTLSRLAGFSDEEFSALLGLGALPTLDELSDQFGDVAESDSWPKVSFSLPPKVLKLYTKLMAKARPVGEDDWRRFEAVLKAVDETKIVPAS